ncbi:MAG: hypothetical protein HRU70_15265 [Phycisphaeraceae bacterium]|nr:MAG: hypothetical protein HRU70_15265 [Phycisphaeraceae bacterium]
MLKPTLAVALIVPAAAYSLIPHAPPTPTTSMPHAADDAVEPEAAPRRAPQAADYDEVEIAGFAVLVERAFLRDDPTHARRTLAALTFDLELCVERLPGDAVNGLREWSKVWVTRALPGRAGFTAAALCYHESEAWVTTHGYGKERARAVEVCNAANYLAWRAEQPMSILHEMAHAWHARLGHPAYIDEAFERAKASGVYDRVGHALGGDTRRAYAMNNSREFFAELSEAYFGRNDFEPFTRPALEAHDSPGAAMVRRAWGIGEGPGR